MSFEEILLKEVNKQGFGAARYLACFKERAHASKSALDSDSNSIRINLHEKREMQYSDWRSERYLVAENLSYDVLVTLYDVNTSRLLVVRDMDGSKYNGKLIVESARRLFSNRSNIEARIIGLQNGEGFDFLIDILKNMVSIKIELVEVDLFGTDVRHIAIDTKSGMSYNVLLNDKNYMPGELANKMTKTEFEKAASELAVKDALS